MRIINKNVYVIVLFIVSISNGNSIGGYDQELLKSENSGRIYLNERLFENHKMMKNYIYDYSNSERIIEVSRSDEEYEIYLSRYRYGKIKEGKQDGEWIGKNRTSDGVYICRKEHFKKGIREGDYVIFNQRGDTLYHTVFVNGKGVEKDYYPNGQLYYVGAKDAGYFVDTLKVYRPDGMIFREELYYPYSIDKIYEKKYYYKRDTNLLAGVTIHKTDNDTIYVNEAYYPNGSLSSRKYKLKDKYKYVMDGDKGKYLSNGGGYVKNGDYVRDVFHKFYYRDTITFDLIRVERKQWQEKVEE